jgi:formylglycine-generating enzyme required for sulfatase activity
MCCDKLFGLALLLACCQGYAADLGLVPRLTAVPAGRFIAGSDAAEREYAYALDEIAYHAPVTREQEWYAGESPRQPIATGAYCITVTPVTNREYAAFIAATRHRSPQMDRDTWASYNLIHPFQSTLRFAWQKRAPPPGREDHPVVLVSVNDARGYAAWLSRQTGRHWRLPTEHEWEKAVRGTDGRYFPWGDGFASDYLNSADAGPFDTTAAGQYPSGISPFGVLDGAGQVYEWTATTQGAARHIVKGGSWDDKGCGVCRAAARHSRPAALKHILIGFRLVRDIVPNSEQAGCR